MIEFEIPEMTCGGCANRIARALSDVGWEDARVEIDVVTRRVRLHAPDGEDIEVYRSAIEAAGYSARTVTTSPPARRGGGCCCASRRSDSVDSVDVHQRVKASAGGCCG
ncbi:heavy metal-associated domain-containing protein [Ramlibacter sp. AN1015]|uniref:heavy-metal-associated domain-containing protein n=1 Tax=Ramlibacter sp. AN1015 TaxID=3133428 RepID=UPI0030BB3C9B